MRKPVLTPEDLDPVDVSPVEEEVLYSLEIMKLLHAN